MATGGGDAFHHDYLGGSSDPVLLALSSYFTQQQRQQQNQQALPQHGMPFPQDLSVGSAGMATPDPYAVAIHRKHPPPGPPRNGGLGFTLAGVTDPALLASLLGHVSMQEHKGGLVPPTPMLPFPSPPLASAMDIRQASEQLQRSVEAVRTLQETQAPLAFNATGGSPSVSPPPPTSAQLLPTSSSSTSLASSSSPSSSSSTLSSSTTAMVGDNRTPFNPNMPAPATTTPSTQLSQPSFTTAAGMNASIPFLANNPAMLSMFPPATPAPAQPSMDLAQMLAAAKAAAAVAENMQEMVRWQLMQSASAILNQQQQQDLPPPPTAPEMAAPTTFPQQATEESFTDLLGPTTPSEHDGPHLGLTAKSDFLFGSFVNPGVIGHTPMATPAIPTSATGNPGQGDYFSQAILSAVQRAVGGGKGGKEEALGALSTVNTALKPQDVGVKSPAERQPARKSLVERQQSITEQPPRTVAQPAARKSFGPLRDSGDEKEVTTPVKAPAGNPPRAQHLQQLQPPTPTSTEPLVQESSATPAPAPAPAAGPPKRKRGRPAGKRDLEARAKRADVAVNVVAAAAAALRRAAMDQQQQQVVVKPAATLEAKVPIERLKSKLPPPTVVPDGVGATPGPAGVPASPLVHPLQSVFSGKPKPAARNSEKAAVATPPTQAVVPPAAPAPQDPPATASATPSPLAKAPAKPGKQQRKMAHNAIERRYRNNINQRIADLRAVVPALNSAKVRDAAAAARKNGKQASGEGSDGEDDDNLDDLTEIIDGIPAATKLNKATILRKATEYIVHLREEVRRAWEEVGALRRVVEEFAGVGGEEARARAAVSAAQMAALPMVVGAAALTPSPPMSPEQVGI
ncbi:hypothetical protein HDU96_002403, partial [Phlyctochytrium bullatum]